MSFIVRARGRAGEPDAWLKRRFPILQWGPRDQAVLFRTEGDARRAIEGLAARDRELVIETANGATAASPGTVLVVEDDAAFAYAAGRALQQRGYRVLTARDAAGALVEIEAAGAPIDVLLADIRLGPGSADGITVAAEVRQRCPGVRVLFVTGTDATGAGAPVLKKPVSLKRLVSAVAGGA